MKVKNTMPALDKQTQEKIEMWKGKQAKLEKDLEIIMVKKGEAANMGDLSENSAYEMFVEEADTYRARIQEVKNIISKLEKGV